MKVRTRFAPSPTGYMHLGNLRTAIYTYLFARSQDGSFILRIEDTDQEREVLGAVDLIYATLKSVGLDYDEGPDVGGEYGPYIQSQRKKIYAKYAKELVDKGAAYYCFCTKERLDNARKEAEAKGNTFKYDKHCLNLSNEEIQKKLEENIPYVIRQNIPTTGKVSFEDLIYGTVEVDADTLDDNVLLKTDKLPTYNFANVVDDHLMNITHVMRGTEYLSSAPKYNLLYEAFGWEIPKYLHLSPIMRNKNQKLSKRLGDPSFADIVEQGYLMEAIINYIALLGWSPGTNEEMFTLDELKERFSAKGLSKSPAIFDMDKLRWFNSEYMKKLSVEEYIEHAKKWLAPILPTEKYDYDLLAKMLQSRTEVFSDLPEMVDFLVTRKAIVPEMYFNKKMKTNAISALEILPVVLNVLENQSDFSVDALHESIMEIPKQLELKNAQVLWPLRIAISSSVVTPGGAFEIASLLGKEEVLARLKTSIEELQTWKANGTISE